MQHEAIWPRYSDDQLSLQTALSALLDISLEPEERVLIRLIYDGGLTQREAAAQLKLSQQAIAKRLQKIYDKLRVTLMKAYGREEIA
jgi:RNA polymerase sigma factor (sigma-70 family)